MVGNIPKKNTKKQELIIIGGGAVGMAVATHVQRHGNYNIKVLSKDSHTAYSQCGMPFVLAGDIPDFNKLIVKNLKLFKDMGIDVRLNTQVNSIDLENHTVNTQNDTVIYDKLVVATGSSPFIPEPLKESIKMDNVYTLRTLSDGIEIQNNLEKSKNLVVIGAGGIGVEIAVAGVKRGINTTLINRSKTVLSHNLDSDMSQILQNHLDSKGINLLTGHTPVSINGSNTTDSVTIKENITGKIKNISADTVVISTGVNPEVSLAKNTGISVGESGGLLVNNKLQVKYDNKYLDDVFAGGECAQVYDFVTGNPFVSQLASTARRMASVIAENLLEKTSTFNPITNPWIGVIGDYQVGNVGLTEETAYKNKINTVTGSSTGFTRAGYYPGGEKIYIKLLFNNRCLSGAQIIGGKGVKERIDGLSLAIRKKTSIDDMLKMETCYTPPVSELVDPITYAVKDAYKNMDNQKYD
ncbi:FAD-dependent oxidoreductase [Methanohalobium sp.]|uniref:FAD-dependent oxidoreductase n=1 Tax=Methanohalobium sp. TaxID=2837493 RepID=UPI0025E23CD1|nr:FAD-dependent oxidoreductase [Methanohalobium sp.]